MAEWSGPQLPTSRTERTGMIKRLVVREVRDCWQAALLLVPPELVPPELVPPVLVPPQVLHRLGKWSERLLLGV